MQHTDARCSGPQSETPIVSILLPVFNAARTLPAALASVLSQTYERWELLVLDDGSSDGSLELARSLNDPRIRIFDGEHLGLPAQLNRGVRHSRGIYCARMDADDLAYPHRIQRQMEFLESHPEVDLVSTSIAVFHSDGRLVGVRRTRQTHAELCGKAWTSIPMAHPTWMGKTQWFKAHPYRENMRGMEDRDLLTRTFASSVFAGMPAVLLAYREDTISLRKQFIARRETLRHLSFQGSPVRAFLLGAAQTYRFTQEVGACATGLQARLQRKRVALPTAEERQSFEGLWSRLTKHTETPSGSGAPLAASFQRPAQPHLVFIVTSDVSLIFFRGQIRYLRQAGFAVTCISSPGPRQQIPLEEGAQVISLEMARGISPLRDLWSLARLVRLLRQLRPDIVNSGTPKAGLLGGIAAALARVPHRLYTLHGLRLETARGGRWLLLHSMELLACRSADRVRAVSSSLRTRAIELKLASPASIYVVGPGTANGVDLHRFWPTPERQSVAAQLRRKHNIAQDAPVIGFVGRMTRDKGIHELGIAYRQLIAQFPALRLVLIGTFEVCCVADEHFRQSCLRDPNIITVDEVADLAPYYLLMDLLLLPTYREGFGNVPIECQAMGVPVITTNATGARDAVRDGLTGILVPVGDAGALAVAAASLLADPARRKHMGVAGQAWVRDHFAASTLWNLISDDFTTMLTASGIREERASSPTGVETQGAKSFYRLYGKRLLDVVVSATLLVVLGPLLLATAVAVRFALGSPVLFRQQRPGTHGRPFTLVKFRTMKHSLNAQGQPLPDAERLTAFGRFLRSASLDELPELINVLRGEMSLVGPRPLLMEYLGLYTPAQQRRHDVLPGITGWAQINGRNAIAWQQRLELDADYVRQQSFTLDLRILWRTVAQVLRRTGISSEGHDTMPRFRGTEHG